MKCRSSTRPGKTRLPNIVLDPILKSSSGADLLDAAGTRLLIERMIPLAAVVTPNVDEAAALTGVQVTKSTTIPNPPPNTPRTRSLGAVASPDGKFIYYARRQGGNLYNVNFPLWQLARRTPMARGIRSGDSLRQPRRRWHQA